MKHLNIVKMASVLSVGVMLSACNEQAEKKEVEINLEDQDAKVAYAIGVSSGKAMARNIATLDGTDIVVDKEILVKAFADGINETAKLDDEALQTVMNEFRTRVGEAMQAKQKVEREKQEKLAAENLEKGKAFLDANKAKEGVTTTESGLQYKVITAGEGKQPTSSDRVKVHYTGTLIDGSKFDSSVDRGEPATFGVTQVIAGWTEALQLMKVGSKWELTIPADIAYGAQGRPGSIPGNSVLIFEVELLEIIEPPKTADAK